MTVKSQQHTIGQPPRRDTRSPTGSESSGSESGSGSGSEANGSFETQCATDFVARYLSVPSSPLTDSQTKNFLAALNSLILETICQSAWFPNAPHLGNARRCILNTSKRLDKTLTRAADASSIPSLLIMQLLPSELALWIDPGSVSYRAGSDHSPIVSIWEDPALTQIRILQQQQVKQRWSQSQLSQSPPQMIGYMSPAQRSSSLSSANSSPQLNPQQMVGGAYISLPQRKQVTMKMPGSLGSSSQNLFVN
ncbi:BTG family-domain-containing protein [Chytriomyces sp. MP71]|nr:BTG family-domain-containing protein [Chytriomyces sp. MP71]